MDLGRDMHKEWFVLIDNVKEGPYSIEDLRRDRRVTPDTLVWRQGFETWIPIRNVPELKSLFEEQKNEPEAEEPITPSLPKNDTLAISMEPPFFWIFIALIVVAYVLYEFFAVR